MFIKRPALLFVFCFCAFFSAFAQSHDQLDKSVQRFQRYYNAQQTDSLFSMLSPRIQQLMPLDKVTASMGQLRGQVGPFNSYEFMRQDEKMGYYRAAFTNVSLVLIAAVDSQNRLDVFRFVPDKKEEKKEPEAGAIEIIFNSGTVALHGTLTMPEASGKVPVVLIIAGSGPTDRDGNSTMGVSGNTYRMLADSLRQAGIACVRYDKRGIGASAAGVKSEQDMTFDDMINDAAGFVGMLGRDPRFLDVFVMGHSEGSMVGMVAAQRGGVKKYISLAGAGEGIDKVLKQQLSSKTPAVQKNAVMIMDSLKKGFEVKNVDPELQMLFRASIQPFMRSWLKYDPQLEIKKLKIPVLIVQGENDLQVKTKEGELLKKALPAAQLVVYKDMNHLLKDAPHDKDGNMATYKNATLPLTSGLVSAIVKFIKK